MIGSTYRLTLGDIVCVVFCDADQIRQAVPMFPNVPADTLTSELKAMGYDPDALKASMNVLYIKTPEHNILLDTGLGVGMSKLPEHLLMAGIELNKIDTIIISHGHGDHIGGIIGSDGKPIFPKAQYYCWKSEWEHWIAAATKAEAPNEAARKNLLPIQDNVTLIEKEGEFLPGIHAVHSPGHTGGHMAIMVESKGQRLLDLVDAIHQTFQVKHPDWAPGFDSDPVVSTATREKLLGQAADENLLILAYHFPFPGLGHVGRSDGHFEWKPV